MSQELKFIQEATTPVDSKKKRLHALFFSVVYATLLTSLVGNFGWDSVNKVVDEALRSLGLSLLLSVVLILWMVGVLFFFLLMSIFLDSS